MRKCAPSVSVGSQREVVTSIISLLYISTYFHLIVTTAVNIYEPCDACLTTTIVFCDAWQNFHHPTLTRNVPTGTITPLCNLQRGESHHSNPAGSVPTGTIPSFCNLQDNQHVTSSLHFRCNQVTLFFLWTRRPTLFTLSSFDFSRFNE